MSENTASSAEWNINWHTYDGARIGFEITTSPHGSTLPVCETRHFRPGWRETWTPEELERHANLIAAAPKLLEALKEELSEIKADIRWASDSELHLLLQRSRKLEAAIAKAEGRE